jgi:hypothetical protein
MKRKSAKEQELADNARLLRAWSRHHAEKLKEALAGVHGAVMARLMNELKNLRAGSELVDFIAAQDWSAVDAETRFIALHEINVAHEMARTPRPGTDQRSTLKRTAVGIPVNSTDPEFPVTTGRPPS